MTDSRKSLTNRREWLVGSGVAAAAGAAGCSTDPKIAPAEKIAEPAGPAPMEQILQYARGLGRSQIVYVAAELGIADLLAAGPRTTEELARATSSHSPSLYRLLRALVSLGILSQGEPNRFRLTAAGELLRSDHAESVRDLILWNGSEWRLRAWSNLAHSVRTSRTAMNHTFGMGLWDYMKAHPADSDVLNKMMTLTTARMASALVGAYNFSGIETVADIGGGEGLLLATVLKSATTMRGVLFELPEVARAARTFLESEGVMERCEVVGGDFFKSVPPADAYLMMRILQSWDDASAVKILESCRRALKPNGRVLVVEKVVAADATKAHYPITDIDMLVETGGRERTREEYRSLLDRAGFQLNRVTELAADMGDGYPPSVIDGRVAAG